MPHISSYALHAKAVGHLLDKLGRAIEHLKNRAEINLFFNDLLTPTERMMLAKRLAIILMLEKGFTFAQICSTLKVSESTISAMRERMDRGGTGFHLIIMKFEKDENATKFFENIKKVFEVLTPPPKIGKGRWRGVLYMK